MHLAELDRGSDKYLEELNEALRELPRTAEGMELLWDFIHFEHDPCICAWRTLLEDFGQFLTPGLKDNILHELFLHFDRETIRIEFPELTADSIPARVVIFEDLIFRIYPDGTASVGCYSGSAPTVTIPAEVDGCPVAGIEQQAFENNQHVKAVILPMTLRYIGSNAFRSCFRLLCVSVGLSGDGLMAHSVFPPSLRYIGECAFAGTCLQDITFTSPRIQLSRYCFGWCRELENIWFREAYRVTPGFGAFISSGITQVRMPKAFVEDFPPYCFARCRSLKTVEVAYAVSVREGCFSGCEQLESLTMSGCTEFLHEDPRFSHRSVSESAYAPGPLAYVEDDAFDGCENLRMSGLFRTMRDALQGIGISALLDWVDTQNASRIHMRTGKKITVKQRIMYRDSAFEAYWDLLDTDMDASPASAVLIAHGDVHMHHPKDWNYTTGFALYDSRDVWNQFREIPEWNPIVPLRDFVMEPGTRCIDELSNFDVVRLCMYRSTPEPLKWDWENPALSLDADLGGDALRDIRNLAGEYLYQFVEHRLYGQRTNMESQSWLPQGVEEYLTHLPGPDILADENKITWLRWGYLYGTVSRYHQVHKLYRKFKADRID